MIIYTLPFIAALTGWLTNFIAVKMLFHPREKRKFLFIEIQGIFPKRQKKLAQKLGHIVSNELFSFDDVKAHLNEENTHSEVNKKLEEKVDNFLDEKLAQNAPMLKMFLNDNLKEKIRATLLDEFNETMPEIIDVYTKKMEESVDIEKIVHDKVVNFSSDKLEEILYSIMKKEFRFIEILGGILGFIIGLIQLSLLQLK